MRTIRCSGRGGGGGCLSRGISQGCVFAWGSSACGVSACGVSAWGCLPDTPHHEQNDWQTGVKTFSCRNFVAGGNKNKQKNKQRVRFWTDLFNFNLLLSISWHKEIRSEIFYFIS